MPNIGGAKGLLDLPVARSWRSVIWSALSILPSAAHSRLIITASEHMKRRRADPEFAGEQSAVTSRRACSNCSTVYVANYVSNTVSVIATASNTVTATITVGSGPIAFGLFIQQPATATATATPTRTATATATPTPTLTPTAIPVHPRTKADCMNGGWMRFTAPAFKNQGQCIAYVNHQGG